MTGLKEKIAYLQGLASGLGLAEAGREGQVLDGLLDALGDMAEAVEELRTAQSETEKYVEYMDMDLGELEDEVYSDDETLDLVEAECPGCGQTVYFEEDVLSSDEPLEVTCPKCGDIVYNSDGETVEPDAESAYGGAVPESDAD